MGALHTRGGNEGWKACMRSAGCDAAVGRMQGFLADIIDWKRLH